MRQVFDSERVGSRAPGGVFEGRRLSEGRRGWEDGGEARRRPWRAAGSRRVLVGRVHGPWLIKLVQRSWLKSVHVWYLCEAWLKWSGRGCAEEAWTDCANGKSLGVLSPVQGLGIYGKWRSARRGQDSSGSQASCRPSKSCLWSSSRCNQLIDIPIG